MMFKFSAIVFTLCSMLAVNTFAASNPQTHSKSIPDAETTSSITKTDSTIAPIVGIYSIDGKDDTASIRFFANETFTAYYANGNVETKGTVQVEGPFYVLYTQDGETYFPIYRNDATKTMQEFSVGNGVPTRFVRIGD